MQKSISVATPLPDPDLVFESMRHESALSRLDEMHVTMTSPTSAIDPDDVLAQPLSVKVLRRDESIRYFNGIVSRFGVARHVGRHFVYEAVVRPWLWALTLTADCRVFQDMTVPDIVKSVFADHGVADYKFNLFRSYRTIPYCVQYRETDFAFIARLLEQEGIYWFFEHVGSRHILRLVDFPSAHDAVGGYQSLPYFANVESAPPDLDHVIDWTWRRAVETGATALRSYDFERPSTLLESIKKQARKHPLSSEEVFDWQGEWTQIADGDRLVANRLETAQAERTLAQGRSNSHGPTVGYLMGLERHPHDALNTQYLVASTHISAGIAPHESGGDGAFYDCKFSVVAAESQFRPARVTPKPFVQGPQTAVVVGPAGDEIYTDKHGRVKVQFFWDRRGKNDQASSCWVRVSHPWAGKNFGAIHIPRIGQEVVVDFLEGDPDQPLITGRVYNAEQMPPWELPANATQSGILTRSSKGGSYTTANALRFEDKKGEEQLWLHAEKDSLEETEHDDDKWVGNDRRKTIDRDETTHVKRDRRETVDGHENIVVHKTRSEEIDGNETITIHSHRKERVDLSETISVGASRTEDVGANESVTIAQNQTFTVGSNRTKSVGSNASDSIGSNWSINVGKVKTETIGLFSMSNVGIASMQNIGVAQMQSIGVAYALSVGAMMVTTVGQSKSTTVGKTIDITAGEQLSITVGEASLVMKSDGTININGKDITLVGSANINLDAKKNINSTAGATLKNKGADIQNN